MTDEHQHANYDCGGKGHGPDASEVQWCHDCTPHAAEDEEFPSGYPPPQALAVLAPYMKRIIAAAIDYDSNALSGELTTAEEFARVLAVDVERADYYQKLLRQSGKGPGRRAKVAVG